MKEEEIEELRSLRRQGLSYDEIAKISKRSKSTVIKYCRDIKPDRGRIPAKAKQISLPANPLDTLKTLNDLINASATTGIMTGSALASIHRGFIDDSKNDTERIGDVMKGMAFLGGQLFSAYRAIQEISKQTYGREQRRIKIIKSPGYEELERRIKFLEEENKRLRAMRGLINE